LTLDARQQHSHRQQLPRERIEHHPQRLERHCTEQRFISWPTEHHWRDRAHAVNHEAGLTDAALDGRRVGQTELDFALRLDSESFPDALRQHGVNGARVDEQLHAALARAPNGVRDDCID
jgi:hypothetical protein